MQKDNKESQGLVTLSGITTRAESVQQQRYSVKNRNNNNTEIGNNNDYISCCYFKFHAILRSSDNWFFYLVSCIYIFKKIEPEIKKLKKC